MRACVYVCVPLHAHAELTPGTVIGMVVRLGHGTGLNLL